VGFEVPQHEKYIKVIQQLRKKLSQMGRKENFLANYDFNNQPSSVRLHLVLNILL
jgi:hypothetical protein